MNEFFEVPKEEYEKSYAIHEETKVLPNGRAIIKYDEKSYKNSDKLNGLIYFETDSLLDVLFDDPKDHTNELQELNLSFEKKYNSLLMLHELMMLPVRYVDVKYVDENGGTNNIFGLLTNVNEDSIELFINNNFAIYKLNSIISVSYSGRYIYKRFNKRQNNEFYLLIWT